MMKEENTENENEYNSSTSSPLAGISHRGTSWGKTISWSALEEPVEIDVGERSFSDPCEDPLALTEHVDEHQAEVYTEIKPHICEACGMAYDTEGDLNRHAEQVHDEQKSAQVRKGAHKCDLCGKCFRYPSDVKTHKNRVHLGVKPYSCEICSKCFADKFALERHV